MSNAVILPAPPLLQRAAWGVRVQFFVAGVLFATWGVHVPTVKAHYGLGEQALAVAMMASGVGSLLSLSQAGRVIGRKGPRAVAVATGLTCTLVLASLLASQVYAALLALMLVYGIAGSLFDVAINAEATEIERLTGRSLMGGFHGMFSLGGMAGATLGAALLAQGVTPSQHLLAAATTCAAAVLIAGSMMLRMAVAPDANASLSVPRGALLLMGVLAVLGMVGEGAMYDWSVLYLKQEQHSDAGTAALAYASFSAAMAAARFGGDWVRSHISPVGLLRVSGALGAVGMALALLFTSPAVSLVGFALVGLGFANVVPVLFSAAGKVPGVTPAHGIAAVSSMGVLGMMAGPPLIGVIAEHVSLTAGLATVVVFACVLALAAKRALPPA
jgi:predicted MFS family arabinose efflux permease